MRFVFGAVVLSFNLLALAVLNLLCAPLIRRSASSRLFSVCCRFVTNSAVLQDHRVAARLAPVSEVRRGKLDYVQKGVVTAAATDDDCLLGEV